MEPQTRILAPSAIQLLNQNTRSEDIGKMFPKPIKLMEEIRESSLSKGHNDPPSLTRIVSMKKKCVLRNFEELWHEVETSTTRTEIYDGQIVGDVESNIRYTQHDQVDFLSQDSLENNQEEKLQQQQEQKRI
jgi:hypothetical protein